MAYTTPSEVVARQLSYFEDRHALLAGELEDTFATELTDVAASVQVFTTNYAYASSMSRYPHIDVQFGAEYKAKKPADMVLFYWPKAKAEAEFLLNMLFDALGEDTEICVVGENRSGVRSIEKMFAPLGTIRKFDSARRCSFYWGKCENKPAPFKLENWFNSYPIKRGETSLTVRALPGVFSQSELDVGTALLLDTLPALSGAVLDFGCGAGVIGAVLKQQNPSLDITMADVSALAVASAEETLRFNNLEGKATATDVFAAIDGKFDAIVTNPPFHAGLDTSYTATETLIAQSPEYLTKGGQMVMVANRFLKYPPLIERAFGACQTVAASNKFSIYRSVK